MFKTALNIKNRVESEPLDYKLFYIETRANCDVHIRYNPQKAISKPRSLTYFILVVLDRHDRYLMK